MGDLWLALVAIDSFSWGMLLLVAMWVVCWVIGATKEDEDRPEDANYD